MNQNLFKSVLILVCMFICNAGFSQPVANKYSSPYTISINSVMVLTQVKGASFLKVEVCITNNMSKTLEFLPPTSDNFRLTILKNGEKCVLNKDENLYYFQYRKNLHLKPNQTTFINLSYDLKGLTLDSKPYPLGKYQISIGFNPIQPLSVLPQESDLVDFEIP